MLPAQWLLLCMATGRSSLALCHGLVATAWDSRGPAQQAVKGWLMGRPEFLVGPGGVRCSPRGLRGKQAWSRGRCPAWVPQAHLLFPLCTHVCGCKARPGHLWLLCYRVWVWAKPAGGSLWPAQPRPLHSISGVRLRDHLTLESHKSLIWFCPLTQATVVEGLSQWGGRKLPVGAGQCQSYRHPGPVAGVGLSSAQVLSAPGAVRGAGSKL